MILTKHQTALANIAALTAVGNIDKLKAELQTALDNGLTINEAKSAIEQLYAYCGFPRSINGLNALISVVNERKSNSQATEQGKAMSPRPNDNQITELGTQVQTQLIGQSVNGALFEFSPNIDRYLKNHLFGDIFADDTLTHQQRELVTVAALGSLTGVESQLKSHYHMARNTGLNDDQFKAIADILAEVIGKEAKERALRVLNNQ